MNTTGDTYEEYAKSAAGAADEKLKAILIRQIQSPVQWQKTIEAMAEAGLGTIVEAGPGKTLTGLIKKIAPQIVALHVEDAESLYETIACIKV